MTDIKKAVSRQKCDIAASIANSLAETGIIRVEERDRDDPYVDVEFEGKFWRIEITGPWEY